MATADYDDDGDTLPSMEGAVVVVDDSDDVRDEIRAALEQEGHIVYTASSGREAVRALRKIPRPRVVLLDVRMPGMSGLDVLRVLGDSRTLSQIPVVLMADEPIEVRGVRSVAKPVDLGALVAIVNETPFDGASPGRPG